VGKNNKCCIDIVITKKIGENKNYVILYPKS